MPQQCKQYVLGYVSKKYLNNLASKITNCVSYWLFKYGKTIRLRWYFCRSQISAGSGKSVRFRPEPEPKSGTDLLEAARGPLQAVSPPFVTVLPDSFTSFRSQLKIYTFARHFVAAVTVRASDTGTLTRSFTRYKFVTDLLAATWKSSSVISVAASWRPFGMSVDWIRRRRRLSNDALNYLKSRRNMTRNCTASFHSSVLRWNTISFGSCTSL